MDDDNVRYFHFSEHPFAPGERVTSPASRGQATWDVGHFGFRGDVVYVFDEHALDAMDFDPPWSSRLFEVVAEGPVSPDPERERTSGAVVEHSWVAVRARVVGEVDVGRYLAGGGLHLVQRS